jgi:hypothetical protein
LSLDLLVLHVGELLELPGLADLELGVELRVLRLDADVHGQHLHVLQLFGHLEVDPALVDEDALDNAGIFHPAAGLLLEHEVLLLDIVLAARVLLHRRVHAPDDEIA